MVGRTLPLAPLLLVLGCEVGEPPGATGRADGPLVVHVGVDAGPSSKPAKAAPLTDDRLGTLDDNLPFAPNGTKLTSLAWRTWVYTDTGPKRRRYGYLRVGETVDARGPAITNEGCAGGWYRINPRGFVCIGKGATLDPSHPTLGQALVRPARGQPLPYLYAMATEPPPLLYHRVPTPKQVADAEGPVLAKVARWRDRAALKGFRELLAQSAAPPDALRGQIHKPYGVERPLQYVAHAGRAGSGGGFSLQLVFSWEERFYGLTVEHDIIALDNTELVAVSDVQGVELGEGEGLPVGFVRSRYAPKYQLDEKGAIKEAGAFRHREAVRLTGASSPGGFLETSDGFFVVGSVLLRVEPRQSFPSFAKGGRKWIDISIKDQTLVAYVGTRPVYVALVSTGRGELADPETTDATVRGTFMIHSKHLTATMDGDEDRADSRSLRDVPYVQYFHKGYALHAAYWHDDFGKVRSHGCVNLAPTDAAWLFEWTDPEVPHGWHSVMNLDRGTVVHIHP